jgi:hypothetical protein
MTSINPFPKIQTAIPSVQTKSNYGTPTLTNYGGSIPGPNSYAKQFYQNDANSITWFYTTNNNTKTLTPIVQNSSLNVYIPGNLTVQGQILNPSDIQWKENIIDIANEDIEKVLDLEPKKYHFKDDLCKKEHYGFIAQDLEGLFPTLVEEVSGKKHVNYLEFIPLMIAKMKQMQEEINHLKSVNQEK